MITRQFYLMDSLTSEESQAGGNAHNKTDLSYNERRDLEMRARRARAEGIGNGATGVVLWLGQRLQRLIAAIKADFKLRAAETQLYRMSDRELSDLGLCRADIPFAVRDTRVEGVAPDFVADPVPALAANRDTSPALMWAGRA